MSNVIFQCELVSITASSIWPNVGQDLPHSCLLQYEKHLESTGQQPSHEFFKEYAPLTAQKAADMPMTCMLLLHHAVSTSERAGFNVLLRMLYVPALLAWFCLTMVWLRCRMAAGIAAGEVDKIAETKVRPRVGHLDVDRSVLHPV